MRDAQVKQKTELEKMKDKEGAIICHRCQQTVKVVDQENDKFSKMTKA